MGTVPRSVRCLVILAFAACTASEPTALELEPEGTPWVPSQPTYLVAPEEQPVRTRPTGCWTDGATTWTIEAGQLTLTGERTATYPLVARGPTYSFTRPGRRHRAASRLWRRGETVIVHDFSQRDGRTWHRSGVRTLQRCEASTSHSS